jgi:hypothetical protein
MSRPARFEGRHAPALLTIEKIVNIEIVGKCDD